MERKRIISSISFLSKSSERFTCWTSMSSFKQSTFQRSSSWTEWYFTLLESMGACNDPSVQVTRWCFSSYGPNIIFYGFVQVRDRFLLWWFYLLGDGDKSVDKYHLYVNTFTERTQEIFMGLERQIKHEPHAFVPCVF